MRASREHYERTLKTLREHRESNATPPNSNHPVGGLFGEAGAYVTARPVAQRPRLLGKGLGPPVTISASTSCGEDSGPETISPRRGMGPPTTTFNRTLPHLLRACTFQLHAAELGLHVCHPTFFLIFFPAPLLTDNRDRVGDGRCTRVQLSFSVMLLQLLCLFA
jgi:hypothetical protein